MKLRIDIACSFVLHLLLFTAALAVGFRDAAARVPEASMLVSLLTGFSDEAPTEHMAYRRQKETVSAKPAVVNKETQQAVEQRPLQPEQLKEEDTGLLMQDPRKKYMGAGRNKAAEQAAGFNNAGDGTYTGDTGGITLVHGGQGVDSGPAGVSANKGHGADGLGPGGAVATRANPDIYRAIRASIEKALIYPVLAKKRGIEGTVFTAFSIGRTGQPENIRVIRSSGSGALDTAAVDTVRKASPFPLTTGEIEVPITFRLRGN